MTFTLGTKVRMVNCVEAEHYESILWVTASEPWTIGCGEEIVKIRRYSDGSLYKGGFATRCLEAVE
jgi:hypothetical protein